MERGVSTVTPVVEVFQVSRLMLRLSLLSHVADQHRASREFRVSRMSCVRGVCRVSRASRKSWVLRTESVSSMAQDNLENYTQQLPRMSSAVVAC